jgi:hypothetical protein
VASLRNRGRAQLRRLRSPRALVAVAAGGGYIWWFLIRPAAAGGAPPMLGGPAWAPRLVALGLTLLAATWWFARPAGGGGLGAAPGAAGSAGGSGPARALAFTPAEEHLLFPAPVSRRGLVRWKLWRAQLAILVNTLIWTVLLRGGGGEPGAWRRALAVWALVSALFLPPARRRARHRRLAGARRRGGGRRARRRGVRRAGGRGRRLWRLRRLLPAALFALAAAALVWAAVADRAGSPRRGTPGSRGSSPRSARRSAGRRRGRRSGRPRRSRRRSSPPAAARPSGRGRWGRRSRSSPCTTCGCCAPTRRCTRWRSPRASGGARCAAAAW